MGSGRFQAPTGFRDSPLRALANGEVIASAYQIKDEIARTETGVVFEARDMLLDRAVAFKLAWRDAGMPSLLSEARRCSAVRDPCAVAIYGMGAHNGVEYVVAERVTGTLLKDQVAEQLAPDAYLGKLRALVHSVARAHESGIAVGDISGATVLVEADERMVLGRLSMSQVPAFGRLGQILAPEVVRGEVEAHDPAAAEAIDLYGLGCAAIELARGSPPFAIDLDTGEPATHAAELRGHREMPPPRLADLRPDLAGELSDLVEWLLAKQPGARPPSAREVLDELDAIIERVGTNTRSIRVLVVDDDTPRARLGWSLARRAHASAIVETASEGTDAAHKLNRDAPDLVFIRASLRGVMNALELCMYARGLRVENRVQIVIIGDVNERDVAAFGANEASVIPDDAQLAETMLARVRAAAKESPRRRKPRTTVSG
jgi:serine/threonine protein kinase